MLTLPKQFLSNPDLMLKAVEKERCERSLSFFFRTAWQHIDPAPYVHAWHIDAIAEHLEYVSSGDIRRLLINIPPRHAKSTLVTICWPAWVWAKDNGDILRGPKTKFLCLSYSGELALDHARLMRKLVLSEWYKSHWGNVFQLSNDQEAKGNFENTCGGQRISGGIDSSVTGRGGDIKILDDPHKVKEVESELIRKGVINTYDETLKNRVTSPKTSAEVIVMQRVAENDLSGHILAENDPNLVHLMLPAEHDPDRHCVTRIGWEDPREEDGEVLWPEQWGAGELAPFKKNPFQWAGQYQQFPVPRGGGIIKSSWWKLWPAPGYEPAEGQKVYYPEFDYILAATDTAYETKEENDYSACVILGIWTDRQNNPKIMVLDAWRERLEIHDCVEKIIETCRKRQVDTLLIERKASGISIMQEIIRLTRGQEWQTIGVPAKGDKSARLHSVVTMFTGGLIYAPDRQWATDLIDEVSLFPRGAHDDRVDALVHGLMYLRKTGLAKLTTEATSERRDDMMFVGEKEPIYDV